MASFEAVVGHRTDITSQHRLVGTERSPPLNQQTPSYQQARRNVARGCRIHLVSKIEPELLEFGNRKPQLQMQLRDMNRVPDRADQIDS